MLTYLNPQCLRRGELCLVAVSKVKSPLNKKPQYGLVTFYNIASLESLGKNYPYDGEGGEYLGSTVADISKKLYDAFIAQSKRNHKRYNP